MRRLPWGPLAEVVPGSMRVQAGALGVHGRQLLRWRSYGLSLDQADRCATLLGLHPAIVWGIDWDAEDDQAQLDLDDVA